MKLKDLKPNPANPRKITDAKLKMLQSALNKFGDLSGIVFNKQTENLVGGHQRVKVLPRDADITIEREYENPTPSGTVAEGFVVINSERFRYREVSWDELTEKAANIAANQHGGEWDLPQLSDWLLELDHANFDLELTGFDQTELENLMAPVQQVEGLCDEDEIPEHVEPKSKLGDLYQLGTHRLLCGDATNIQHVERLMNGEKADMVFTDPPYGMNLDTDYSKMHSGGGNAKTKNPFQKGNSYSPVIGDDQPFDPGIIFGVFDYVTEIFLWGADYYYEKLPKGGTFMVWDKNNGNEGADKMIGNGFEYCWTKQKHKKEMCRIFGRGTFGHDKVKVHPTQKPVQLAEWFFDRWAKGSELIIDLFGGSGSTLIACEKTKRRCFMMELDPHYCDVIVARWEKYTGKKAQLTQLNREENAMEYDVG